MLKIYEYKGCSTCRNALKFLDDKGLPYSKVAIRETPPSKKELKMMLKFLGGQIKKLFNVSGQDYRAMGLKDKIDEMSEEEALELLSQNGNLVKRPFAYNEQLGLVGFKAEEWNRFLK